MKIEPIREHLAVHAGCYFPASTENVSIKIEEVKQPSTNALARFVLSNGYTTARVIGKWAPKYPENNESLTEFAHYRLFNSRYGHKSAFRCPKALSFIEGENVLLTEEEDGLPLRDACRSLLRGRSSRQIFHAASLAGRWLCAFHDLTSPIELPMCSALGASWRVCRLGYSILISAKESWTLL